MKHSSERWESGDAFLVAMGGAAGVTWAIVSVVIGVQWWDSAYLPRWEALLRAALLWPLFAAFHVRLPGTNPFTMVIVTGLVTGLLCGFLLVLILHRSR